MKLKRFLYLTLTLSFALLCLLLLGTFSDTNIKLDEYSYLMEKASLHTEECFNEIKEYRKELGLELSEYDVLETGMIGVKKRTSITTTDGELEAKRTSTNPNWTSVYIYYFIEAGLEEGDEVGMIFSGSFPAFNIEAMVAADYYGLKYIVMASIGASQYGANEVDLTFFDMAERLYQKGLLKQRINYISLGGDQDVGLDFKVEEEKQNIINKINNSGINFINIPDYNENVEYRIQILKNDLPNMKMFINNGGTMVALGRNAHVYTEIGYKDNKKIDGFTRQTDMGLLEYYSSLGIKTLSMLHVKYIAPLFDIEYDPASTPTVGLDSGVSSYYSQKYKIGYAIAGIIVFIGTIIVLFRLKKKTVEEPKNKSILLNE